MSFAPGLTNKMLNMKHEKMVYVILPAVLGFGILGANAAQACGWFGGSGKAEAARQQEMFERGAELLGIGADDVKNAWAEGKTLRDLAAEKGITREQLQARMKDYRMSQIKAQIKVLADKKIITQEQADKRIKFMEERQKNDNGRARGKFLHGWRM